MSLTTVDWSLLTGGGHALFAAAGLHTYARSPGLQAGPPSLVVVDGLTVATREHAVWLVHIVLALVAPIALFVAEKAARHSGSWQPPDFVTPPRAGVVAGLASLVGLCYLVTNSGPGSIPLLAVLVLSAALVSLHRRQPDKGPTAVVDRLTVRCLLTGLLAATSWGALAGGVHLDDGLALVCLAGTMYAVARGATLPAAVLVGAAAAFKPWAVVGLPLLLGLPRRRGLGLAVAVAIPAASWLPFFVADRATLGTAGRPFQVSPLAAVHFLGVHSPYAPAWLRSAELVVALVVAAVAARRDGWASAVGAGMVARLLLDPAALGYYTSSTILTCAMGDLQRHRPPWRTSAVWIGLWAAPLVLPQIVLPALRTAVLLVVVGSYLLPQPLWHARRRQNAHSPVGSGRLADRGGWSADRESRPTVPAARAPWAPLSPADSSPAARLVARSRDATPPSGLTAPPGCQSVAVDQPAT